MWFKCSALVACVHTTKKRSQKLIYIYIKEKKKTQKQEDKYSNFKFIVAHSTVLRKLR